MNDKHGPMQKAVSLDEKLATGGAHEITLMMVSRILESEPKGLETVSVTS